MLPKHPHSRNRMSVRFRVDPIAEAARFPYPLNVPRSWMHLFRA